MFSFLGSCIAVWFQNAIGALLIFGTLYLASLIAEIIRDQGFWSGE